MSTQKFGKQRADQDREFEEMSIWGKDGNPAIAEDAQKAGIKAKGDDLKDPYEFKSAIYKKNYKEGGKMYKDEKMTKLLKGEISEEDMEDIDVDKIFNRRPLNTPIKSPGGIILKP